MENYCDQYAVDCDTSKADDKMLAADLESRPGATDARTDNYTKCQNPTVLILGKVGTAKIDIAKHIFRDTAFGFGPNQDTGLDAASRKPSLDLHHHVHLFDNEKDKPVMVIVMDTNPIFSSKVLFEKVAKITGQINAIFLVMTHGRVTIEDYKPLNDIIKEFNKKITPNILHNCCYLVVNGCEGHTEASRKEIIATYREDPLTRDICQSVKEIIPVGFPDLTLINHELHEHYEKTIKEDEDSIKQIVKMSLHENYPIEVIKNQCKIF